VRGIADAALEDPKLVVRTVNVKAFRSEMDKVGKIYQEAWCENWGAVPLTEDEFDRIVGELKLIADRDLFFIAEYAGEPAGMSLVLSDVNQALKKADGRLFPLGLLKILWHGRKITSMRMPLMGIRKEYRMKGIDAVFCRRTYDGVKKKGPRRSSCMDSRKQYGRQRRAENGARGRRPIGSMKSCLAGSPGTELAAWFW
jgi:hypothetical protein